MLHTDGYKGRDGGRSRSHAATKTLRLRESLEQGKVGPGLPEQLWNLENNSIKL